MKRHLLSLLFLFVSVSYGYSQGTNCANSDPFCTGTTYTFPNSTGTADLGTIGCCSTTPNPAWYFMEIDQSGNMAIQISQTSSGGSGIDVDFVLFGPYASLPAACASIPGGAIEDCSYSTASVETADVTGGIVGEIYVLLLTNYADVAGTITFNQSGGAGSADCSLLCGVTGFTANPTACVPATNTYSVSGTLSISNPPSSGTCTITNSCGGSQVINAPFGTSINYNLAGLTANGSGCTITATFSADATCNSTTTYTAPAACTAVCNISGLTSVPTACVPATNTYSVSGSVTFTNPPASGTLTVTNSCGGSQVFNAPFVSPLAYNITGVTANGAACTVTATFSATPACTRTSNFTAPAACTVTPCAMTGLNVNIGVCNPATTTYQVTGTATFTNPPAGGTLIFQTCGGTQTVVNPPFVSPVNFTINNVPADGTTNCNVTAFFSSTPACSLQVGPYTEPVCLCNMDLMNVNINPCDPATNEYTIDVHLEFTSPPATGTLVIANCSGDQVVVNAPFVSPLDVTITGINSDGDPNCTVTATFTADAACTITSPTFTEQQPCVCPVDAGTFTSTNNGSGTVNYALCFNDDLDIISNGNFIPPADVNDPTITYDPGLWLMVYSCPPTVFAPNPLFDALGNPTDPCFLGVGSTADGAWNILNNVGDGSTLYFVPITMYSMVDGYYSVTNSLVNCYELGTPVPVTFLPDITAVGVENCTAGTVTVTVSGGYPAILGGNFTASGLSPASATFNNTTCTNNGTIVISGLQGGDNYSFTITDDGGCPHTFTGGPFVGPNIPVINPAGPFCVVDPATVITSTFPGGTWSSSCGGCINAATGSFNPATAGIGTWDIFYTAPGCASSDTIQVVVNNAFDATINPAGPFCASNPSTFLVGADPGGTWSATCGACVNAATGAFNPALATIGNNTITYTIGGACGDVQNIVIQVIADADATINPAGPYCISDPAVNMTSVQTGGTWTGTGITNAATGTFNPGTAGIGTHTITYSISGVCGDLQTINVVVNDTANTAITPAGPFCVDAAAVTLVAAQTGGTWSATCGACINAATGSFNPATAGAGTHTITYTIAGACGNSSSTTIVVNPLPVISFTVDIASGCSPVTSTVTNTMAPMGTSCQWLIDGVPFSNTCASFTNTYTTPGCYDITLVTSDANGCSSTSTVTDMICVTADPVADFTWGPTDATILYPVINFQNTSTGAASYVWDFGGLGSSTQTNPSFTFPNTGAGTYNVCLEATSANGCIDTTCQYVIIYDEFLVYVPNSFTPDGDGVNDFFTPIVSGHDPNYYEFYIFNRWGELIFESHSNQVGWDGFHKAQMAKQDVYVWKLKVRKLNDSEKMEFYGHVSLLK